jgi:hypothetical protein
MNILETKLGCADLEDALSAPIEKPAQQLAGVS